MDPQTSRCGHSYCGKLVSNLKAQRIDSFNCVGMDGAGIDRCNEPIWVNGLVPDSALNTSIIKKRIICTNTQLGCSKTVALSQLRQHLDLECEYETKECSACNQRFPVYQIQQHEAEHHGLGLEMALIYQELAGVRDVLNFYRREVSRCIVEQLKTLSGKRVSGCFFAS